MKQEFDLSPQGPDMKRLLLAVALMTGFLMVFNIFFATPIEPHSEEQVTTQIEDKKKPAQIPSSDVIEQPETISESLTAISHRKDDGGYRAQLSNKGGQIKSFELLGYETPIQLIRPTAQGLGLFSIRSADSAFTLRPDAMYQVVAKTNDGVVYERTSPEGVRIRRSYQFQDGFTLKHKIEIQNTGPATRKIALDILMGSQENGFVEDEGFFAPSHESLGVVCRGKERERTSSDEIKKDPMHVSGQLQYAGFDERYFLSTLFAGANWKTVGCDASAISLADEKTEDVTLVAHLEPFDLAPGASHQIEMGAYLGPKQLKKLEAVGQNLEENIDFGWFGVISRPMLWLLVQIHHFVGNFGWAIVILTLLIKLITFPLTQKSYVSMQQMKTLAPALKELQAKYSHDRTQLAQKQMEMYREKGVNPMAGCLPMLIQMPIWFALYQMLWSSVELYQQPFFGWIHDLTQADPFYVLPVAMGVSMVIQTFFQPVPEEQPQMKYVMWGMPVFLTVIMLQMPAGLSLYIFTNNILTIFQQFYIKRRYASS